MITVMWTATDDCTNESTATATITIVDNEKPVVMTPPTDLVLECTSATFAADSTAWVDAFGNGTAVVQIQ